MSTLVQSHDAPMSQTTTHFRRPGDRQLITGLYQTWQRGQSHFQIGDNTNLFDWTYVGNCAYAHLLAADKLGPPNPAEIARLKEELQVALPSIECTTQRHRVPTSEARPLGPYVTPPPNAEKILANWEDPYYVPRVPRPAVRGKFDQFSEAALLREDNAQLQVAGQVFFVTNGEPTGFWDIPRIVYRFFDEHFEKPNTRRRIILPREVGLLLASAAEWWSWLVGKEPGFTRFRVTFSCAWRCFNIERTRRVLGYEPQVGLEEGLKRTLEVRHSVCHWCSAHTFCSRGPLNGRRSGSRKRRYWCCDDHVMLVEYLTVVSFGYTRTHIRTLLSALSHFRFR